MFRKHTLIKYIKGKGVEIGALHNPLRVDRRKASVVYVDIAHKEGLIAQNPEAASIQIKPPDIINDAEDLHSIKDGSVDFVIVCHLLEHLPNPIKAIGEFWRILKAEGILYLSVPDKSSSFDRQRQVTELSHLVKDYTQAATTVTSQIHYQEWLTLVELNKPSPVAATLEDLMGKNYRIHFHTWLPDTLIELFNYLNARLGIYFTLEDYYYRKGDVEITLILKKVVWAPVDFPYPLKERYSLRRLIFLRAGNFILNPGYYLRRLIKGRIYGG